MFTVSKAHKEHGRSATASRAAFQLTSIVHQTMCVKLLSVGHCWYLLLGCICILFHTGLKYFSGESDFSVLSTVLILTLTGSTLPLYLYVAVYRHIV